MQPAIPENPPPPQVKQSEEEIKKTAEAKAGAAQNAQQKKPNKMSEITSKITGKKPVTKPSIRSLKAGDSSSESPDSFKGVVTHELSVVSVIGLFQFTGESLNLYFVFIVLVCYYIELLVQFV